MIAIEGPMTGCGPVARGVLGALPQWFGRPDAVAHYVAFAETAPSFLAKTGDEVAGFATLKDHGADCDEIYVMGVVPGQHRRGVGRALIERVEVFSKAAGKALLQVKTLGPSHPDSHYEVTRAFYRAVGFRSVEEIPDLWGEGTPCLLMVKPLAPSKAVNGPS